MDAHTEIQMGCNDNSHCALKTEGGLQQMRSPHDRQCPIATCMADVVMVVVISLFRGGPIKETTVSILST